MGATDERQLELTNNPNHTGPPPDNLGR